MRQLLIPIFVLLVLGGCAKTRSTVMKSYPPRAEDYPIEVLSSFPTDRSYEEVALLDAQTGKHVFADRSSSGAVEQMKSEARKVGADAIVVRGTRSGSYNWGQGGWEPARADAVAIRWTE